MYRNNIMDTQDIQNYSTYECIEILRSYGIGSRDDAIRVAKILRNGNRPELAKIVLLCWAKFSREKMR